ncbi:MAG: hypothetical protein PF545_05385, partial [Elusimicrobia bacterium]|nr:hypothetical protein [Elusimicrobiota bacterium]
KENIKIQQIEWGLISVGATMIFITFIYDFTALILRLDLFSELLSLASNHEFKKAVSGFIPGPYKWWLFIMGETAVLTALYLFYRRILIKKK